MIYIRLCKSGYASSITDAKQLNVREVIQACYYDEFVADWERAFVELNKT